MTITFELPADVEQSLKRAFDNVNHAAKEAALVELYRQRKITHHQLSQSLQISRFETDDVLKRHHVTEDLISVDEFNRQVESLQRGAEK